MTTGMKEVPEATIVVGCHRSGTTIFFRLLGFHPSFGWPSQYTDKLPSVPALALLSRIYDLPFVGPILRRRQEYFRFLPKPVEPGKTWSNIDPQFHILRVQGGGRTVKPYQPKDDVVCKSKGYTASLAKWQGKRKVALKFTTRPDVGHLRLLFEEPQFIHVRRNPLAVVNSLLNKVNSGEWFAEEARLRIMKLFPEEYVSYIETSEDYILAFLSCYYCYVVNSLEEKLEPLYGSTSMKVLYEDFITKTASVFQEVTEFLQIEWMKEYRQFLSSRILENRNYKCHDLDHETRRFIADTVDRFLRY